MGLISSAVKDAFNENTTSSNKRAQVVLKKLMMKLIDEISDRSEYELQWFMLDDNVTKSFRKKWGIFGLTTLLQHRPIFKVGDAIKNQSVWKVSSRSGVGSLCVGLIRSGVDKE